ncbi:hypothetical protein MWG07_00350 [Fusobacterium necrophorum]|uniref:Phage tail tape measure protein n=1 Tax=Fusobacterium necrophorum TaxID=859 RepID=A0AAW6W842_9FUSO|nr:hypothetical protein [Fusobacterium necrophorum]MDK4479926.1 hypothetical protein [Fusobacterium necrophorum]MDK4510715.1 hypothetical protein [Fusobacterium necrophorum]
MAKNINVLLSLKDQFTKPLQNATASTTGMNRALQKAERQMKKFGNAVKAGFKKTAKYAAIGVGAMTAAATVFAKQSIDAAKDQLRVEKMLETNMKRTSNASTSQIQAIKDEASALQSLGVVGDEVALAGASQLAVYGLRSDQIKKLMPNLNDMIAKEKGLNGTQEDSIAMADVIGKALAGKTKGLLKYGVQLSTAEEKAYKTMTQEQRMNLISKKLTSSIGGVNKALRETDEGKIVAAQNAWGDMKEELGKKLLPYLGKFAGWFENKIPDIQNFILGVADTVEQMIMKAEPYLIQIKDLIGSLWDKAGPALKEFGGILLDGANEAIEIAQSIINNWDRISPIIYTATGAVVAYNVATGIRNNMELIYIGYSKAKAATETIAAIATGQLTIKQWALNAAMNANPVGLVIGAIAALIGIVWLAWKNWDKISGWLIGAWEWVKKAVSGFCEVLSGVFLPIWDSVVSAIDKILHPLDTAKKAIGGLIDKFKFWNDTEPKDKNFNITENKTSTSTTKTLGRKALGTSYFKGGATRINEGGRTETAVLPAGTKILSHEQSKALSGRGNQKIEVYVHISGNFIGEKEHMERYAEYTGKKVLAALGNM